jgi:hypothetical protein
LVELVELPEALACAVELVVFAVPVGELSLFSGPVAVDGALLPPLKSVTYQPLPFN